MRNLVLIIIVAFSATTAQASVTLNMSLGFFYESDGLTPLAANSTLVLLADADNDGFGDLTLATDSWVDDIGDIVLAQFPMNGFLAGPNSSFDAINFDLIDGVDTGDDLMLVWYDQTFEPSDEGPGKDVSFGTFRSDSVISFSDIAWEVPADGNTVNLNFITTLIGGDSPESAGAAQYVTVPEPAAIVLLISGAGLMAARRRRVA